MPDWILGLIGLAALTGFIGYAFYQGTKVRPDPNNRNVGPEHAGQGVSASQGDGGFGLSGF
jgi:hypothetical protein